MGLGAMMSLFVTVLEGSYLLSFRLLVVTFLMVSYQASLILGDFIGFILAFLTSSFVVLGF